MSDSKGKGKRGGARAGAGRPKTKPDPVHADRSFAGRLIEALTAHPGVQAAPKEPSEITDWRELWFAPDLRIRLDTRKFWYDKRDGKAVHTVNHLHDKPLEVNMNVSIAEIVREVRERKEKYERGR